MNRGNGIQRQPHPKDCANLFSLVTFAYMFKFLYKGKKQAIEENDLTYVMNSLKSKELGDKFEKSWEKFKPSITRGLISCYGFPIVVLWMINLSQNTLQTYSIPWAMGKFVSYFEKGQTKISKEEAFGYAMVMVTMNIIHGIWSQHYSLFKTEYGIRIQCSISSLLYRKTLLLSQQALARINTGNIVTGITKDAHTVHHVMLFGMDFIGETIQVVLVIYLLYQKVGMASAGGIGVICICMLSQLGFAKSTYQRRGACNEKSDQRLAKTEEVLSSIRLIKMYGWESFFEKRLLYLRKIELKNLYILYILKTFARIIGTVSQKIAHISTLLILLWLGERLDADVVYYTTNLFHKMGRAMVWIPISIQSISECIIALKRLGKILNEEENHYCSREAIEMIKPKITFVGAHLKIQNSEILKDLNLDLKTGLNIIVGPTGCGKTSLLKTILREYHITKGEMITKGTISYAMQHPWLFPSSLKQNIIFGEPYNEYKYNKILQICSLEYDIKTFNFADEIVLTDCGANLSGGQQARINLARALYKDSDIYLLDDSLSSLDVNIRLHVFNNAIRRYLNNKLCVLVTHSTDLVSQADNVIIMEKNRVIYSGRPCSIPVGQLEIRQSHQNGVYREETETYNNEEKHNEEDEEETSTLLPENQSGNKGNIYKEIKKSGKVDLEVYKGYMQYGGGFLPLAGICSLHIICEVSHGLTEKFLSNWLNAQTAVPSNRSTLLSNFEVQSSIITEVPFNITSDDSSTETYFPTLFPETNFDSQPFSSNIPDIATKLLNFSGQEQQNNMDYFDHFIVTTAIAIIFSFIAAFASFYFALKVAKNIHKSMVVNILQGRMNFFDTHLIGNILTRFSRDLFVVDESIPNMWHGLKMIFVSGMSLILIAMVNPLFAGLSIIMGIIFYLISVYIISSTRNLQRLSGATLSPLIGHLNTTLDGLVTIRAHGTQQLLKDEFDKHQDLMVTSSHLKDISAKVMGFYCHVISSIFTSFVTIRLIYVQGVLAGDAGLLLSQTHMISHHIEWGMILWILLENSMTSVERLLEYTDFPLENDNQRIVENWPQQGEIKFQDVNLTYRSNGETVLKNLNFIIYPQEKIGVVGRTGAGKSSILVTLFKMYDFAGDVMIDNVDIKTLSLRCLRTNIAIIPQDPVIFTGTLRTNIDPNETLNDDRIWEILHVVNLDTYFKSLDEDIFEKNLSIGQKQLISVARAMTRKRKLVILDEATANMDEEMDDLIHQKIMDLFQLSTVITVAHRLHTVLNSDRILVMDMGKLVEFDTPQNLLTDSNGLFYKMIHKENGIKEDSSLKTNENENHEF